MHATDYDIPWVAPVMRTAYGFYFRCVFFSASYVSPLHPHNSDHADDSAQLHTLNDALESKAQKIEETKLRLRVSALLGSNTARLVSW